jgi:hypothetical protein
MATSDAPVRQPGSEDHRAQVALRPDRQAERVARAHDRSAETFERHAVLLDRYGAHHSANTERRLADDERRAAATTRRRTISQPGTARPDVSRQPEGAVR